MPLSNSVLRRPRSFRRGLERAKPAFQDAPYWLSAFLTGLCAVGFALAFKVVGAFSTRLQVSHPALFLFFAPLCFLISWWIVHRFAPEAAGSGIPQVMAANELDGLNHSERVTRLLGLRTAGFKVLSALICLLGGGAIGREGPTIQIGAAMFHSVGTRFRRYWPLVNHRTWIVAGGAAGIAAAFNTPLGGLIFAIEELATDHFGQFRSVLISAVILSGLVSQWLLGSYLYLGYPQIEPFAFSFLGLAALTGVLSGLGGALFGKGLYILVTQRRRIRSPLVLALVAMTAGVTMATLAWAMGPSSLGSGTELISDLLFKPGHVASWEWVLTRSTGSMISYLSGSAGGIFAPSLSIGAALGSQLSDWFHSSNANLMVLLGMIGFLTGVTRAPFTSFVLVLEMTDHHSAIFPMMLAALLASAVAKAIDANSFYEHMKGYFLDTPSRERPTP